MKPRAQASRADPRMPKRQVRLYPPVGLSLLFRPLPKTRLRPPLDVRYQLGDGSFLRFSAREALGVPEQTLLLVLLELAAEQYAKRPGDAVMDGTERGEVAQALWSRLHQPSHDRSSRLPETLRLSCTWVELNRRCGCGTGGSLTMSRRESLRRLCEVVVWEETAPRRLTTQSALVVWMLGDDQRVHVALNPRLAAALMGGQYAPVLLTERLALGSDTAMAVHAFLSTCVRRGNSLQIAVETLLPRLWPDPEGLVPPGTYRRRHSDVRLALTAVGKLADWSVEWVGTKAIVRRAGSASREASAPKMVPAQAVQPSTDADVRVMTFAGHDTPFSEEFRECAIQEKTPSIKHLPRNDMSGLFITTE